MRICFGLLEHDAFKDIVDGPLTPTHDDLASDATLDDWLNRNVTTSQHLAGTCKMGPDSDPMAVVDQFCRVRGLEGLRVADTSVMPNVVRANTNTTAITIGERVADWNQNPVAEINAPPAEANALRRPRQSPWFQAWAPSRRCRLRPRADSSILRRRRF